MFTPAEAAYATTPERMSARFAAKEAVKKALELDGIAWTDIEVSRRANGASFSLHLSTRIASELWTAEPREPVEEGERVSLADGGTATFLAPVDAGTGAVRARDPGS